MSKITEDQLWKSVIEDFFQEFVAFFFSEYFDEIDFLKGFEFLDKELQTILARSNNKNRTADKLVKVFKKSGEEEWLLIHIEVQGYKDLEFAFRMFTSYYRIVDKFNKPVSAFVVYTDNDPDFHPKEFHLKCMDTELAFKFGTYKLLDHPPTTQIKSKNPFSIIMEVAWYALDRNKLNDENQREVMLDLIRRLFEEGYSKVKIHHLVEFIRHYVRFEKKENKVIFEEQILIITKNVEVMSLIELSKKAERDEGRIEGLDLAVNIRKLYDSGKSILEIAKELNVPMETVEGILGISRN